MPPVLHVAAIHANAPSIEAPRFIVGQDPEGHWVAIETHGRVGGLFRSRQAAVDYAEDETAHRPDGVFVSGERIEFRL